MASEGRKSDILTVPNALSLIRLLLVPIYSVILLNSTNPEYTKPAVFLIGISCLTDMLDGAIARRFNCITTLGKILDPIADKVTQLSLFLILGQKYPMFYPVMFFFLIKETFQAIIGAIFLLRGFMLDGALWPGKAATAALFLSAIVLLGTKITNYYLIQMIALLDWGFLWASFSAYFYAYLTGSSLSEK